MPAPSCCPFTLLAPLLPIATPPPPQVTPAIKEYVEDKISNAVKFYSSSIKKIDVTLSARGGDTGTHGAK